MQTTMKSLVRNLATVALFIIAVIGIFSEPFEDSLTWGQDMFISKAIGFGAMFVIYLLNRNQNKA